MKTLLRLTLCSITLLGLHTTAYAQKTLPAYIVTAASDTIQGQLLKESESKRTFRIRFDDGNGLETYEAKTIQAYGIGDSLRFEAKDVFVDEMQNRAFLQVIVDGPTKLYYSRDLNAAGQFYIQKPGEPTLQLRQSIYKSILSGILSDCGQMQIERGTSLERSSSYTAKSLANIVTEYNICKEPATANQVFVDETKVKLKVGIWVGGHNSVATGNEGKEFYTLSNEKGGNGLTGGVSFNFDFGKRISIQPELLFTTRHIEGTYTFEHPEESGYVENFILNAHYMQLPVLLKYTMGSGKLQPYIAGGFSASMLLQQASKARAVDITGQGYDTEHEMIGGIFGYVGGVGLQQSLNNKQRLLLEVRYSQDLGLSSFADQVYFKNIHVLAGFAF